MRARVLVEAWELSAAPMVFTFRGEVTLLAVVGRLFPVGSPLPTFRGFDDPQVLLVLKVVGLPGSDTSSFVLAWANSLRLLVDTEGRVVLLRGDVAGDTSHYSWLLDLTLMSRLMRGTYCC